ncbi:chorismate mutase [Bacillus sp. B15-48]|uniref:chorismate mutase n=1 Tax=Bacillus sp. B15-48 TaxID=1548601 RepID=UPI00193F0F01|nr:chorismate mutase [Bacillus sp. B15-48]MBM4762121.1 chorismate mutase [Bacillus sp. B15-48]
MIRGIRGAITIEHNTEEDIQSATERVAKAVIAENNINPDSVTSVFISVTDDVNAGFPAKVIRQFEGWKYVPVMCMKEISVPGSLPKCIRVMFHVNTEAAQDEIKHIYLDGAIVLRPDLHNS